MPAPSPMTNPSRSLSNGREERCGSALRVLMARMAQNPPMPIGTTVASVPPAKIALASPILMVRQASPMAWVEGVRAGRLEIHREQTRSHVRDEHRNHERRNPSRTAFEQYRMLLLGGVQSPDAG